MNEDVWAVSYCVKSSDLCFSCLFSLDEGGSAPILMNAVLLMRRSPRLPCVVSGCFCARIHKPWEQEPRCPQRLNSAPSGFLPTKSTVPTTGTETDLAETQHPIHRQNSGQTGASPSELGAEGASPSELGAEGGFTVRTLSELGHHQNAQ